MRLRDVEFNLEQHGVGGHRLARLDVALHHDPVERGGDGVVFQLSRIKVDRGCGLVALLLSALERLRGEDAPVGQSLRADDVGLGHPEPRPRVVEPGERLTLVHPGEYVALPDLATLVDENVDHAPGRRRAEAGVVDRLDDAGRINGLDRRAPRGVGHRDGRRGPKVTRPTPTAAAEAARIAATAKIRRPKLRRRRSAVGFKGTGNVPPEVSTRLALSGAVPRGSASISRSCRIGNTLQFGSRRRLDLPQ